MRQNQTSENEHKGQLSNVKYKQMLGSVGQGRAGQGRTRARISLTVKIIEAGEIYGLSLRAGNQNICFLFL